MKVVGINTSPRKDGNTARLLGLCLDAVKAEGIETEYIHIGAVPMSGCIACGMCFKTKDRRCVIDSDPLNEVVEKMAEAEGIVIGSPTYFANVTSNCKSLIDRAGYVARANDFLFRRKVGAAVTAMRRAGAVNVFNAINAMYFIQQMIVPGSTYWNLGVGRLPGEAESDEEGVNNMKNLGENIAFLIKKIHKE